MKRKSIVTICTIALMFVLSFSALTACNKNKHDFSSEWKNDDVIMSLERPLTLKYTDRKIFEDLQSKAMVNKTAEEQSKQEFLDLL